MLKARVTTPTSSLFLTGGSETSKSPFETLLAADASLISGSVIVDAIKTTKEIHSLLEIIMRNLFLLVIGVLKRRAVEHIIFHHFSTSRNLTVQIFLDYQGADGDSERCTETAVLDKAADRNLRLFHGGKSHEYRMVLSMGAKPMKTEWS